MMNMICVGLIGLVVVLWNQCNKAIDLAERALDQRDELLRQLNENEVISISEEEELEIEMYRDLECLTEVVGQYKDLYTQVSERTYVTEDNRSYTLTDSDLEQMANSLEYKTDGIALDTIGQTYNMLVGILDRELR